MYNIDLYSYWKKPFEFGKNFSLRPLDEEGKEKYLSENSHNFHYVKRTDPFVFKSICGTDYDTLIKEQQNSIKLMKSLQQSGFCDTNKTDNNILKDNKEFINNNSNRLENKEEEKNSFKDKAKKSHMKLNSCGEFNNQTSTIRNNLFHLGRTEFRPYFKKRNFKDTYGYDFKTSFKNTKEKYIYDIKSLKKSNFNSNLDYSKPKRRYDGFTYNEDIDIPRIRANTSSFEQFNEKMKQTLNSVNKPDNVRRAMNEEEMQINLMNQTSKNFLQKYHLPNVVDIANLRKKITRQKIGLSKELGEKYNPYTFIIPSKNRNGRNYVGDLFKH